MVLLLDIGNTNTHIGLGDNAKVRRRVAFSTEAWFTSKAKLHLAKFVGTTQVEGVAMCSVVPRATVHALQVLRRFTSRPIYKLTAKTIRTLGVDYPKPSTIGTDRLANAVAAVHMFGAPVAVVDFGTAVTIDVVNARGNFIGGVIGPGLALVTEYMHQKTALLPRVQFRLIECMIGRSTKEAMLLGATYTMTGLVRETLRAIKQVLKTNKLPLVATGGYAKSICRRLPELTAVVPDLTLEGLRIEWIANRLET